VHGSTADCHGPSYDAGSALILNEIARPRILPVQERAISIAETVLDIEETLSCLDHRDVQIGLEFGQLLRQEGGGDAASDDADIGFKSGH
jgi:hypothetical protein